MKILFWAVVLFTCVYTLRFSKELFFEEKNKLAAVVVAVMAISLLAFPIFIKIR